MIFTGEVIDIKTRKPRKKSVKVSYLVVGGVGGKMYLGSAASVVGWKWQISPTGARTWAHLDLAEAAAAKVNGAVLRREG